MLPIRILDACSIKKNLISKIKKSKRVLLRISPLRGVKQLSREFGIDPDVADKAHELFAEIKRIDIIPSKSGLRGFQLIIDGSTALYFYQNGNHFVYDGFEGGEYEKGDVRM